MEISGQHHMELCSFWNGLKDLSTLHKFADKVVIDH